MNKKKQKQKQSTFCLSQIQRQQFPCNFPVAHITESGHMLATSRGNYGELLSWNMAFTTYLLILFIVNSQMMNRATGDTWVRFI